VLAAHDLPLLKTPEGPILASKYSGIWGMSDKACHYDGSTPVICADAQLVCESNEVKETPNNNGVGDGLAFEA